jgi:hypothetical protein
MTPAFLISVRGSSSSPLILQLRQGHAGTAAGAGVLAFPGSQAIGGAVDEVYDRAFMALFPRTDWAAARAKMKERGLVGFEGASFAAVRGLARLSQSPCTPISDKGWNNLIELIR